MMETKVGTSSSLNDMVGGQITNIKLNGANYLQWAKSVKVFLTARGKVMYLSTNKPLEGSPKYEEWIRDDAQIMTWLWNSMEPSISSNVMFLDTSKEIWETLKEMYSSDKNISRVYQLFQDIFTLQKGDKSLGDYCSMLRGMWEELNVYQPLTNDLETQRKQREEFRVAKLLSGLGSEYEPMRAQILGGRDIPSVAEVYARLQRFSMESSTMADVDTRSTLESSSGRGDHMSHGRRRGRAHRGRGRDTGDRGRGHDTGDRGRGRDTGDRGRGRDTGDRGRGSDTGDRGRGRNTGDRGRGRDTGDRGRGRDTGDRGRGRGNSKCMHCGSIGHTIDTCRDLHVWANQAYTVEDHQDSKSSDTHIQQPSANTLGGSIVLSRDEYLKLLNGQKPSSSVQASTSPATFAKSGNNYLASHQSTPLVIDFGASNHMPSESESNDEGNNWWT